MSSQDDMYAGRRLSYDGALCTVRCKVDSLPKTKGEWLGIEWDDPSRGKHNGIHRGTRYFKSKSHQPLVASFIRAARKADPERTVLEAIKYKYAASASDIEASDAVVISGKVAEEIGFEKIIEKQSTLANLNIMILDHMVVSGVAPRGSSVGTIKQAQEELATLCPNVLDLDLGYNPIEAWTDIEDVCLAFPKLRTLKLNSIRLRSLNTRAGGSIRPCFQNVQELHLNECLLNASDILDILQDSDGPRFPALRNLWLSQNELADFVTPTASSNLLRSIHTLVLENNLFTSLDQIFPVLHLFPQTTNISLQSNQISKLSSSPLEPTQHFPPLKTLNLSRNDIWTFAFIDLLPQVFPNLSALRVSKNPFYDTTTTTARSSETSYYLTLARIPTLKTLNYTQITPRDREEGEIYYLSVTEKDIRATLRPLDPKSKATTTAVTTLTTQHPQYTVLCTKHDRPNLLTLSSSTATSTSHPSTNQPPSHPPGTVASRLTTATFHHHPTTTFTRTLPRTLATSSVFALVSREMALRPLSFKLVYESEELDPARDDVTTRSQMAAGGARWDDWGEWDADEAVERSRRAETKAEVEGKWTDDGVLVKDGRKWRRREVEMLFGGRGWGGWLDGDVRTCRVRVESLEGSG